MFRGHLSDCNFGCSYCPFSKVVHTKPELENDARSLTQFVNWIAHQSFKNNQIELFFTPFGEALVRSWYQDAVAELTGMKHVKKITVQTNLSFDVDWLSRCQPEKLSFWSTYHPEFVSADKFANTCTYLDKEKFRLSAGMVGVKEHFSHATTLRRLLPQHIYLWINAYKSDTDYYTDIDIQFLESIDPLFRYNLHYYVSRGKRCRTGRDCIAVDGYGNVKRCHFVKNLSGNIYSDSLEQVFTDAPCPMETCHCHIGYIFLEHLQMNKLYGENLIERIPNEFYKKANVKP
jgi:sulfatase maturation enzyme AslB (radical SAM superfamily)